MNGYKKIGITGAGGFIGKGISNYLNSKNYGLVLFSNDEIIKNRGIKYIKKDLNECNEKDFEGIEVLIHLAGTAEISNSFNKNFILTKLTLEKAIKAKVKYFFLMSSYAVYGHRKTPAKINEELVPSDEYSLSKILSEYLLKKELLGGFIQGSIIRSCSIYGGGKGFLDIIKKKINDMEEINIDGNFERQYLHISDLCPVIEKIINEENLKQVYNIEGERISSEKIFFLLKNKGLPVSFNREKKKSYLCEGEKIKPKISVESHLIN